MLPVRVVRAMLVIRLNTLLGGLSGVGLACIDLLAGLLNAGVSPEVPALGSVGTSEPLGMSRKLCGPNARLVNS